MILDFALAAEAGVGKACTIPFGNNFNIKDKLGNHLPLDWENEYTLLGVEIEL